MIFFELATGIKFRASYRKEAVCYHEGFVPFTAIKFWYSVHYKYDLKLQFYFKISCLQLLGSYYFSCARSCIPFPTFYELKFWCIICSYLDLPDPVRGDASGSLNAQKQYRIIGLSQYQPFRAFSSLLNQVLADKYLKHPFRLKIAFRDFYPVVPKTP